MTLSIPNLTRDAPIRNLALPVLSNTVVNADYRLLHLAAPDDLLDACRPGQFFHLLCPTGGPDGPVLRRPMSIYGASDGTLRFLYKVMGKGTGTLAGLRPSDRLDVVGPLGVGFRLDPGWRHIMLLARGVGLATLAPLADAARALGIGMTAICSARAPEFLMSLELFADADAEVIAVHDRDGSADVAVLEPRIESLLAAGGIDAVFTCGSSRLLRLLQRRCAAHGISGQVALEQQMACGIGMCQCCVRPFNQDGQRVNLRVCREGPVFDIMEAMA